MAENERAIGDTILAHDERAAGLTIAVGAALATVGFGAHPPGEGASLSRTIELAFGQPTVWRSAHVLIGFGVMLGAVGGLVLLATRSPLADGPLETVGWGLVVVFTGPLFVGFLLEASVVTDLALAGDDAALRVWYGGFVTALSAGSFPVFLGYALVSAGHYRTADPLVPRWASALSAVGWATAILFFLGLAFGVSFLWVAQYAAAPGVLWLLAVGVQLFRHGSDRRTARPEAARQ